MLISEPTSTRSAVSQLDGQLRRFHADGSLPQDATSVFVFGSNLAGIHGKGAALVARQQFGAKRGKGHGLAGRSYAIATRSASLNTLPLEEIAPQVARFLRFAAQNPATTFFVTRVGCGYAGYADSDMAPMFKGAPPNCSFAEQWRSFID
jgi:hypothetical protein